MIGATVNATGLKALDKFSPELAAMIRRAGPYLFERIKARARKAETSDGNLTAKLGRRARATKPKLGARPVRDYKKTGQMMDNLAVAYLPAKGSRKEARLKLWFRGAHQDTKGRRITLKRKNGTPRRKTNQEVANLAALVMSSGRPLSENYQGRPYHAFVEPSKEDLAWLNRELDKEIQRALRRLPLDLKR
jgi:hypothetical protein